MKERQRERDASRNSQGKWLGGSPEILDSEVQKGIIYGLAFFFFL